jgi:hypothetical protein
MQKKRNVPLEKESPNKQSIQAKAKRKTKKGSKQRGKGK